MQHEHGSQSELADPQSPVDAAPSPPENTEDQEVCSSQHKIQYPYLACELRYFSHFIEDMC